MERIKGSPGLVVAGLAAVCAMGYLALSSLKGQRGEEQDAADLRNETQEVECLENSFFVDASGSKAENETIIVKWVNAQIEALLGENDDNKLTLTQQSLSNEDYLRIMMILQNRMSVLSAETKKQALANRSQVYKNKGLDSLEYLKQLIADCRKVIAIEGDCVEEIVTKKLNLAPWVLETSQDKHIGDVEVNKGAYTRKFLEIFLFFPFKPSVSKTKAEAMQILQTVFKRAVERIGKSDTNMLFDSPEEYMFVFNALCVDLAREEH